MNITYERLSIPDVILIRNRIFEDERGRFQEIFRKDFFTSLGIRFEPVQENHSFSHNKWTIRGLHFQRPPANQAKLAVAAPATNAGRSSAGTAEPAAPISSTVSR